MFDKTITLFNRQGAKWYPTVLSGVDLIIDRANVIARLGETSDARAVLHIPRKALTKPYIKPKEYEATLTPTQQLTFNSVGDFFVTGSYLPTTGEHFDDDSFTEGFYSYMRETFDDTFAIVSVGEYFAIPHFEVMGK